MPTGYDPNTEPNDAVRFLVGDTTEPFLLSDAEIQFALDQASQEVYAAAAVCARALSARFAREVDDKFETIESKNSQARDGFAKLASMLEREAKKKGGLGVPLAGGISKAEVEAAHADTDRVRPFFYDNLMNNPPAPNE